MIYWWLVFIALTLCALVAACAFIPLAWRQRYFLCPKDRLSRLAFVAQLAIWVTAAVQSVVAPGSLPVWQRLTGAGLFIAGHALVIWARAVNPYFLPVI